jgi:hypothetical protein
MFKIKLMIYLLVALGAAGGFAYVYKLKADNAILKANQIQLETAITEQQEVLELKELEFQFIIEANKDLTAKLDAARRDNEELTKKFAKYDIAEWGMQNPERTAETINKAVADVNRCMEIASGSPVVEEDKENKQCKELIKQKGKKNETPTD